MANCEYYAWEPSDDPFADDGAIWSHHFFLYNRDKKRVGYFYLRGISALSPSPSMSMSLMSKFKQSNFESSTNADRGNVQSTGLVTVRGRVSRHMATATNWTTWLLITLAMLSTPIRTDLSLYVK